MRRGPCPRCGPPPFRKAHAEDTISFAPGTLDDPAALRLEDHIFVTTRGDQYDIADEAPQQDH